VSDAFEGALADLITELGRLPGVGPKSAQRLAFHLMSVDDEDADRLAGAIRAVKQRTRACARCFNLTEDTYCRVCRDAQRDASLVCVVETARDLVAIERTAEFSGRYHVLGGALSPIDGVGPEQLHVSELQARLPDEGIDEIVLAMNPTIEGEATASYLGSLFADSETSVTRLASGLPVGGDLEYADEVTLGRALTRRTSA